MRLQEDVLTVLPATSMLLGEQVLFVCTHNSARSQLAAALWERATGRRARSAGHAPAPTVDRMAVAVAAEHGLDLSDARPQGFDAVADVEPDLIVSVCDRVREAGWPFPGPALHWSVPDPVGGGRDRFERAYALLSQRVDVLAATVRAA